MCGNQLSHIIIQCMIFLLFPKYFQHHDQLAMSSTQYHEKFQCEMCDLFSKMWPYKP